MDYSQLTKLTHVELFSGIGSATIAAKQAKLPIETIATSEICRHAEAIRSQLVNDEAPNFGDITDFSAWFQDEKLLNADIVSAGFPCQSFSLLGKQLGWNCKNVQRVTNAIRSFVQQHRPLYLILENVTAIVNKRHAKATRAYLDSFDGYSFDIIQDNPFDRGYLQSRGRVYIVMSRDDVPEWTIDTSKFEVIKRQTWDDVRDKRPNKNPIKGEYMVVNAKRVHSSTSPHIILEPNSMKMNCWTRGAVDAHCNRFSYPRNGEGFRSPSVVEALKVFGHKYTPRGLTTKENISRSSFFRAIGNSWHLASAREVFRQFPIEQLNEWKLDQYLSNFIKLDTCDRMSHTNRAKMIQSLMSFDQLMTTEHGTPRRLTCTTSHKFDMKNGRKIETQGLYLSPSNEADHALFSINTCPWAGDCKFGCLITSGRMALSTHAIVRREKTWAFYGWPRLFLLRLLKEIYFSAAKAHRRGDKYQYRMNGTSDIMWERFIYMDLFCASINGMDQFYDYTKHSKLRITNKSGWPLCYHLTFSVDEKETSKKNALAYLAMGFSVAIVMKDDEKNRLLSLNHHRIIDGDLSDHRPQDPKGSIVLLRTKGALRTQDTEFVKSFDWVLSFLGACENA